MGVVARHAIKRPVGRGRVGGRVDAVSNAGNMAYRRMSPAATAVPAAGATRCSLEREAASAYPGRRRRRRRRGRSGRRSGVSWTLRRGME